tara:strand:+ start:664 stop:1431 length:768 start_codon:yes stop_codon:yes gene_type:complete
LIIKFILKAPILKRLIPSLCIRIFKLFNKNRGYYNINGIRFYLDFLDPVDRQIILNKEYEQDAINFLEVKMRKEFFSHFLDIGANSGYFSFYLAKKLENLKVIAFEPNKDAYYKFKKTLIKNSFKNIKICHFGLSNEDTKKKMITWYKHGVAKTNSTILNSSHDKRNSKIFKADFKVGDKYIQLTKRKILMKIDVENHELSVLRGLIKNLKNNKCMILIEIGKKNFKEVNNFLIKNNYKKIFKSKLRMDYIYTNL